MRIEGIKSPPEAVVAYLKAVRAYRNNRRITDPSYWAAIETTMAALEAGDSDTIQARPEFAHDCQGGLQALIGLCSPEDPQK